MTSPATNLMQRDGLRVALGIGGLIAVVLGLLIIIFPSQSVGATMKIVAAVMGAYVLVVGIVYIGSAVFSRSFSGWTRTGHILLGALYLIGGAIMFFNLGATAAVLALFLSITVGALWLLEGVMAFTVIGASANKVWNIIYGVISVLAGLTLILSPLLGVVTLWLLLGISMVVIGGAQMVRAFTVKPAA